MLTSGEHPNLPFKEAVHLFHAFDERASIRRLHDRYLIVNTRLEKKEANELCLRLALTTQAWEVVGKFQSLSGFEDRFKDLLDFLDQQNFAVRTDESISDSDMEGKLGKRVLDITERRGIETSVSLDDPDVALMASKNGNRFLLSRSLNKPSRARYQRRSLNRPFKRPISLNPVLARAMVNISGVRPGETLLDPFCGTGNIIIEGGMVGARIFGLDVSTEMIHGARRNLKRVQSQRPQLVKGDATRASLLFDTKFDHLVTDPPYGRASLTTGNTERLLFDFIGECPDILKPGGSICITCPSIYDLSERLREVGLNLEEFAYQRVHRSLGRHLYLAKTPG